MSLPARMAAAYVTGPGQADTIRYGMVPVPGIGPTDVLVRAAAVAANHVDTFVRSGAYATPMPTPFIIGRDLVGTVAAAGPGAPGFSPGQRVWCASLGHGGRQGSFAEYAAVPADRLYHAPADIDPIELVAAAHPAATAWLALFRHGKTRSGDTVLIGGAAGNVGSAALAMAVAAGTRVIATARPCAAAAVLKAGATEVVDHGAPDLADRLRAAAPGGYDVHLDTSGQQDLASAIRMLARGGRLVAMAGIGRRHVVPIGDLYTRDGGIVGFAISNASVGDVAEACQGAVRLLRTTSWRPAIATRLPLSRARDAHRMLEKGEVEGRLILDMPSG